MVVTVVALDVVVVVAVVMLVVGTMDIVVVVVVAVVVGFLTTDVVVVVVAKRLVVESPSQLSRLLPSGTIPDLQKSCCGHSTTLEPRTSALPPLQRPLLLNDPADALPRNKS